MRKKKVDQIIKRKFTLEEREFLMQTEIRWIGTDEVSYNNSELNQKMNKELQQRGFVIIRKGMGTTIFCMPKKSK